jgi:hypothetical protein
VIEAGQIWEVTGVASYGIEIDAIWLFNSDDETIRLARGDKFVVKSLRGSKLVTCGVTVVSFTGFIGEVVQWDIEDYCRLVND